MKTHALAAYLQRFFTERLGTQLKASPNTIASYRDTFRLLLRYAADRLKKAPTALQIADIDADLVGHFLADIEKTRGNGSSQPEHAARGHPVVLQVRRRQRAAAAASLPARARHAVEAPREAGDRLSDPRRDRGRHRGSRPHNVARPA